MKTNAFPTVVLGDLHGRRDLLLKALCELGLTDGDGRWIGGSRRLVQLGDVIDRGREPLAAMDLLMRLQEEAADASGEVRCLVGNHEAVAMRAAAGDHYYRMNWTYNGGGVSYLEWLARQGQQGDEGDLPYPDDFYALYGPTGRYGRWIRTHEMACRLGDYVVVHAGWSPDGPRSVEEANEMWAATPLEPKGFLATSYRPEHPLSDQAGLLWSRNQPQAEITAVCNVLGCKGLIAGHTITRGIMRSWDGRLIQIDVGMAAFGGWGALGLDDAGRPWAIIEEREPTLLQADGLLPLPAADRLPPRVPYQARHTPGSLIRLYQSPTGDWAQYFLVQGYGSIYGGTGYEGRYITRDQKGWSWRSSTWPAERIDRFGRAAGLGEVPEDLIS